MKINIYKQEQLDGLEQAIANNNSISYCSKVEKFSIDNGEISDRAIANIQAVAGKFDISLFYPTKSILATTTWNLNDDVFGPKETWAARHTPVHTPTNIDHDHNQTVGHIISTWVINAEGELIADDTEEKDLPNKFHLCNSALIYKFPRGKELIARAEKLISEIEENKKFVSMECLFPTFDYAVISPEKEYYIVERNESTAFLTKHLKIYGGKGEFEGKKIGRFLKNMVFSGKGYVDTPANPESIIFDSDAEFNFSSALYQNKWFDISNKVLVSVPSGVSNLSDKPVQETVSKLETELMSEEAKKIEELKTEVANLQKQLGEVNTKSLQEEIESLKAELEVAKSEDAKAKKAQEDMKAEVETKNKAYAELNTKVEELTKTNTELSNKIKEAEAAQIRSQRVAILVEGGVNKEEAEASVTKFANLDNEQFKAFADIAIKAVKPANATTETVIDDTTLSTAKTEETGAGVTVPSDETNKTKEVEKLRLSLAKKFGYETDDTDGE